MQNKRLPNFKMDTYILVRSIVFELQLENANFQLLMSSPKEKHRKWGQRLFTTYSPDNRQNILQAFQTLFSWAIGYTRMLAYFTIEI